MKKIKSYQAQITVFIILGMICLCLVDTSPAAIVPGLLCFWVAVCKSDTLEQFREIYSSAGEDRPE